MTDRTTINIFSDFTCQFSYVTEAALRRRVGVGDLEIVNRAFELFPFPAPLPEPAADRRGWEEARRLAKDLALPLEKPGFRPRTGKAHEAARFADAAGCGAKMREAIFSAYWTEGRDIGRVDVLMSLISGCGPDPEDLKIALDIDTHAQTVANDRELAGQLRITGTPTLFVGTGPDATILIGARTTADLESAIKHKQEENG